MAAVGAVIIGVGALALYPQRENLAAKWEFSKGDYPIRSIQKQAGRLLVNLDIPMNHLGVDVNDYKQCPFKESNFWKFQSQDKIDVGYYLGGILVEQIICDSSWTLKNEIDDLLSGQQ